MELSNNLKESLKEALNQLDIDKSSYYLFDGLYLPLEDSEPNKSKEDPLTDSENLSAVKNFLSKRNESLKSTSLETAESTGISSSSQEFLAQRIKMFEEQSSRDSDINETEVSELFTTQAFSSKRSEEPEESTSSSREKNHPIHKHIQFLESVKNKDKQEIVNLFSNGYLGFTPSSIIDYQAGFNPNEAQIGLLNKAGVSSEDLEKYQELISFFYKSEREPIRDAFVSLPPSIQSSFQEELSKLEYGSTVLINEAQDPLLLMNIISHYSERLDLTVKPQTNLTKDVLTVLLDDDIRVVSPDYLPLKNQYDLAIGKLSSDGRISIDDKDFTQSFLRRDERSFINTILSAKRSYIFTPSELMSDSRSIFHDTLNDLGVFCSNIIRLPLNEKEQSFDLVLKSKESSKRISPDIIIDIKGDSLSESTLKTSEKPYFSETMSGNKIRNNVKVIEGEFNTLIPTSENTTFSQKGGEEVESEVQGYVEDSFYMRDGEPAVYKDGEFTLINKGINKTRTSHFIRLVSALENSFESQKKGVGVKESMDALNSTYNQFIETLGFINERKNERILSADYRFNTISMLEKQVKDKETGDVYYEPSDWLINERFSSEPSSQDTSLKSIMIKEFENSGQFNLKELSRQTGLTPEEVNSYLLDNQIAFLNNGELVHHDIYLSGEVGNKLIEAQERAEQDPFFERNVEALKKIQPETIPLKDIFFKIGSHWIDADMVNDFLSEIGQQSGIKVSKNPVTLSWVFDSNSERLLRQNPVLNATYSADRKTAVDVLLTALNQATTVVTHKSSIDIGSSELFKSKVDQVQQDFREFIESSPEKRERVESTYNRIFNGYVKSGFNSTSSEIPGMSSQISLRKHQIDSVHTAVHSGSFLFAHDAGSGKTFTQVATGIVKSRLNKKPTLLAVPNHMPKQMIRESLELFPEAKIFYLDNEVLKNPESMIKKLNQVEFEILIVKHDSLNRYLSVPYEMEQKALYKERNKILSYLDYFSGDQRILADLSRSLAQIDKRLNSLKENKKISISKLNVGSLIVDEAHNFKNLEILNQTGNMIDTIQGSDRARTLKLMTEYFYDLHQKDSDVIFATGTPVSNSLLEIFNLQRYLQPRLMSKLGLDSIKNWMDTFLEVKNQYEPDVTGQKFIPKNRYVLKNIPELITILSNSMNVVTLEDAGIKVPDSKMFYENSALDSKQIEVLNLLVERLDAIKEKRVSPKIDNMLKIISDSRKMALSPGLIANKEGVQTPSMSPKIKKLCENVYHEYKKSDLFLGTQLVFCDLGTPSGFTKGDSVYDLIKNDLIEKGMSKDEIAFIHDPKNDREKETLFSSVRDGSVRVLIGSTAKMGEGTNVQERLVASHDPEPPWRPKDIIQRRRRTVRQGNINKEVSLYVYTSDNSFDAYAWSKLDAKNKAFSYIMSGKAVSRSFELDLDPSFSETYAVVTGKEELIEAAKLESELITLNAKKNGLKRKYESLISQIEINKSVINSSTLNIEIAKSISFEVERIKGWSLNGSPVSRKDILANRGEVIAFNGAHVSYNEKDKLWIIGSKESHLAFKRPFDIEKSIDLQRITNSLDENSVPTQFIEEENKSISSNSKLVSELESFIDDIDLSEYDKEILELSEQLEVVQEKLENYEQQSMSR